MTITVPEQLTRSRPDSPESQQISRLAETFNDAIQPVWIHDLSGLCLYANRMAENRDPQVAALVFDLIDHEGTPVARMSTVDA